MKKLLPLVLAVIALLAAVPAAAQVADPADDQEPSQCTIDGVHISKWWGFHYATVTYSCSNIRQYVNVELELQGDTRLGVYSWAHVSDHHSAGNVPPSASLQTYGNNETGGCVRARAFIEWDNWGVSWQFLRKELTEWSACIY